MFKKTALSVVFATMLTSSLFNSQATAASTVSFCIYRAVKFLSYRFLQHNDELTRRAEAQRKPGSAVQRFVMHFPSFSLSM